MRDGLADWLRRWRGWLVALAIIAALLVVGRSWLSERLVPDPRLNKQLELAQAALAKGVLSSPDGRGARELFEAVLAADPDQMGARQGLESVRSAAIIDAERALDAGDTGRARSRLALAEALSAPTAQLQALRARLRDREHAGDSVQALLAQAAAPGIDEDAALALLTRALRMDPGNAVTLDARSALLSRKLRRADAALLAGDVDAAQALVTAVVAADAGHLDLPPVQGRLGEALGRRQAQQSKAFDQARADDRAGRIDSAARRYLQLREQGADAATVQAGLDRAAAAMSSRAEHEAADFHFRAAENLLAKARRWSPGSEAVASAEARLRQSRLADRRLRKPEGAAERKRAADAVARSREAMERGEFLLPPGASAWDQLRVAMAIAPADPAVRAVQRELATRSASCFEQALAENRLRRAQECLETQLAVTPGSAGARGDRRRLAERWMARAEERLGASDWPAADDAVESARRWLPGDKSVEALAARLRRARAATP